MQLLTVGRSLSEAREQPHRYKLKNKTLPAFGKTAAVAGGKFEAVVAPPMGSEVGRESAPSACMNSETVADQPVQPTRENPFPRGRWTLNPFKTEKPAPRPVVQGELSLDKVKPVRNDLTDSDLELVAAMKTQPVPNVVQIGSEQIPIVKAQPMLARVRALFRRRN